MLALVGASGSGKSTIALATMRLLPSHARVRGAIRFEERPLLGQKERERNVAWRSHQHGLIAVPGSAIAFTVRSAARQSRGFV
ncbi:MULTISPECIES: ATP-binding cassette domain-containing protein [unclassified Caballeronia]|uniref:ATP-binding cassette domain-containing protein n=1 Tax=unclassified Caballeronia TaxID=2646786 RepID=UPI0028594280|nr:MULTISPECIES: ATP-binding cassette domain-containing protein [unclassified Caballeronia]MDR5739230.1 hypothetical protein [Caballeronia sp. LZ016]MDR5807719.1 hypothetical protein [Caballeronia sp. LZ019]